MSKRWRYPVLLVLFIVTGALGCESQATKSPPERPVVFGYTLDSSREDPARLLIFGDGTIYELASGEGNSDRVGKVSADRVTSLFARVLELRGFDWMDRRSDGYHGTTRRLAVGSTTRCNVTGEYNQWIPGADEAVPTWLALRDASQPTPIARAKLLTQLSGRLDRAKPVARACIAESLLLVLTSSAKHTRESALLDRSYVIADKAYPRPSGPGKYGILPPGVSTKPSYQRGGGRKPAP